MLPIDSLIRGYTPEEAFELGLSTLESVGIPARLWREGGTARSIVGALATVGSMASQIVAGGIRGNFLEWSESDWLTLLAWYVYKVARTPATFAAGKVTLTNTGGGSFTQAADTIFVRCSRTKARLRVSQAFTLAPLASIEVSASAVESGSASSVGPGEIDEFETPLARVTVSNTASLVGADPQSDASLRLDCLARLATLSPNGPRDAYVLACTKALMPGDVPVSISRVAVLPPNGSTLVRIVLATPSGTPSGAELTACRANIEKLARTDSDTVEVLGAATVLITRKMIVWSRGGSADVIKPAANATLAKLTSEYPIGGFTKTPGGQGYLFADRIKGAIIAADPTIFDVDFDGAGTDIPLIYNQVPSLASTLEVRTV